ncbi:MAG: hypothetical protein WD358_03430 [Nitriliruptoraceae bacterium]
MPPSDRNSPKSGRQPPRDAFERRAARNKTVVIFMAVLMALSLLAVPLTQLLS